MQVGHIKLTFTLGEQFVDFLEKHSAPPPDDSLVPAALSIVADCYDAVLMPGTLDKKTFLAPVVVSLVVALMCTSARADGFDAERFVPSAGAAGGFTMERPWVPFHLGLGFGLFLNFADDPVVERDSGNGDILSKPLDSALTADLMMSLGLFGFAELAVHAPVHLVYSGDAFSDPPAVLDAGGGLGDIRVVPKATLFGSGDAATHFLLGFAMPVAIPTGDDEAARGAGALTVEPRLLLSLHLDRLAFVANGGFRWRSDHPDGLPWGNEITFGLAASYELNESLEIYSEMFGAKHVSTAVDGPDFPFEILGGVIVRATDSVSIYGGATLGLTDGLGDPDFRIIAGIRFASKMPKDEGFGDSDGDGIADRDDDCPFDPEDLDGFADDDGCPDIDNDDDGILDADDECPDLPGEGDGCPSKTYVKIVDGTMVVYGKVNFRTGSADIEQKSESLIDQVAATLKGNPHVKRIRIEGHTDSVGDAELNRKLSAARAESVKQALITRGISEDRLEAEGYGESKPIAPNSTKAGQAKNRRVEFIIVED